MYFSVLGWKQAEIVYVVVAKEIRTDQENWSNWTTLKQTNRIKTMFFGYCNIRFHWIWFNVVFVLKTTEIFQLVTFRIQFKKTIHWQYSINLYPLLKSPCKVPYTVKRENIAHYNLKRNSIMVFSLLVFPYTYLWKNMTYNNLVQLLSPSHKTILQSFL